MKTAAVLKRNRIKPEFRGHVIALNVNVAWLVTVTGVKKETIGSCP